MKKQDKQSSACSADGQKREKQIFRDIRCILPAEDISASPKKREYKS